MEIRPDQEATIVGIVFACAVTIAGLLFTSPIGASQETVEPPVTSSIEKCYDGITLLEFYQGERLISVIQPLQYKKGKFSEVGIPIQC